ncbi:GntR family transcriptional regulator (plasmid) [Pseudonocardia sp. DSM 110487]|uniref:GntR family transcriptional regulator n=1 Tax=Pseudonocardia sp. DSM 110487 TaxID=2865833 RepID=UPI001C6985F5|nr:GntR family transcriptional regulator [Pseudonocardia sp. DSM 110487]QYN41096.1 GntR family transcriptional regulator [Pseudonocardia sp. DSM 110487]
MARVPRYRQIADDLRRRLADGEWLVGSKIPGISALQAEYGVAALETIRQAQSLLQEEGLLEPRQGSGTFVVAVPERADPDRVELRQVVTELQQAIAAAQATLNRVARRLDEPQPTPHTTERATQR